MKSIKPIMFLALIAAFSSCTEMRYANRTRAHVKQEVKEPVKKSVETVTAKVEEVPAEATPTAVAPELATTPALIPATPNTATPAKVTSAKRSQLPVNNFLVSPTQKAEPLSNKVTEIPKQIQKKIKKQIEKSGVADGQSQGIRLMIIGLIILLIGFLLPHPVNSIFGLVGGILVVVGLIIFLLELL